jgi:molybdopterin converting factor small subunit
LPAININFIGSWRIFLGARTITVNVDSIDDVRAYVETNLGPVFEKRIKSIGAGKRQSIWDNSNVLLNGTNIKLLNRIDLKDGDKLDLLPRVAGG